MPTELSTKIQLALKSLRDEARTIQRGGMVLSSRRIIDVSSIMRTEFQHLYDENTRLSAELGERDKKEKALRDEIEELKEQLERFEGWPVPAEIEPEPLPPDYWESAQ